MRNDIDADRIAVQFHAKGASDGCLLCVPKGAFVTKDADVDADRNGSKHDQAGFMKTIKTFLAEDKKNGDGTNIIVDFAKNTSNEINDAVQQVVIPKVVEAVKVAESKSDKK